MSQRLSASTPATPQFVAPARGFAGWKVLSKEESVAQQLKMVEEHEQIPMNYEQLGLDLKHRLAYLVGSHHIPKDLVLKGIKGATSQVWTSVYTDDIAVY